MSGGFSGLGGLGSPIKLPPLGIPLKPPFLNLNNPVILLKPLLLGLGGPVGLLKPPLLGPDGPNKLLKLPLSKGLAVPLKPPLYLL